MDQENTRNVIIATILSFLIIGGWQYFIFDPQAQQQLEKENSKTTVESPSSQKADTYTPTVEIDDKKLRDEENTSHTYQNVMIETPLLRGSISARGTRFDNLILRKYTENLDANSDKIHFLNSVNSDNPFFAEFGFINSQNQQKIKTPTGTTIWKISDPSNVLNENNKIVFTHESQGVLFKRTITINSDYLFAIEDEVINNSSNAVNFFPYARVARGNTPEVSGFFILHEGLIGVIGENGLQEIDYDDLVDDKKIQFKATKGGFTGITDKYWAAILIPEQDQSFKAEYSYYRSQNRDYYQADYLMEELSIAPGQKSVITNYFFAGAKVVDLIDKHQESLHIKQFDLLIDWGWFYFITKPLFTVLNYFNHIIGNFGLSILLVTVLLKIIFFPLANKSYVSMSRMKKFQPDIKKITERYKDNRTEQQKQMMALYKKHKINPMTGCLPVLLQIPVFFALYKVLFVTIEMRHAPFFGWVHDLSAPDPTSIFNLFGLLPFGVPDFLLIGIWPILMGISMFFQMRLNPAPPDPIQAKIFAFMPLFFTFLLATFPAGLVIYWTWNNLLSILQQWYIMRRQGVEVDIIGNTLDLFGKKSSKSDSDKQ